MFKWWLVRLASPNFSSRSGITLKSKRAFTFASKVFLEVIETIFQVTLYRNLSNYLVSVPSFDFWYDISDFWFDISDALPKLVFEALIVDFLVPGVKVPIFTRKIKTFTPF